MTQSKKDDLPLMPPMQPEGKPSMQSLRSFDAVARFGSTIRAADHLHITPSAVTHQLRKLEEVVGVKLVRRSGRNIELTSAGNRYAEEISRALGIIAQAAISITKKEPYGKLCINCAYGFGTYWLSQNLGRFTALYPGVSIKVVTTNDKVDVYSNEVDFSILYGDGLWPDMDVQLLYTPKFFPVCSPVLIDALGELTPPRNISKFPLLHHGDHSNWAAWLAAAKISSVKVDSGTVFTDINMCMAAALAGQGMAISDNVLARQAMLDGLLVKLSDKTITGPKSYYLVVREDKRQRLENAAFINWILSEIANPAKIR